jgi:hypothetical protein
MAHVDGHCATDAEAIYVQNDTSICNDTVVSGDASAGTAGKPFCSMQPVPLRLMDARDLIVVRGTVAGGTWTYTGAVAGTATLVGQKNPKIASATSPAFSLQSGSIYIRGGAFSSSASIGIQATGGTLLLEKVIVDSCSGGGILLDGAAFDIQNTMVTRNGPGDDMGNTWGGLLIKKLPLSGPSHLDLITVQNNTGTGISCSATVTNAGGVLASGNDPVEISPTCGFSACGIAGPMCGAQ